MSGEESFTLNPAETAIVMIEFQNEFTTEGGKLHDAVKACMAETKTIENASAFVKEARSKGCTIIHCPISFEKVSVSVDCRAYCFTSACSDLVDLQQSSASSPFLSKLHSPFF